MKEETHLVWARVGMSARLTQKELDLLNKKNKTTKDYEEINILFTTKFYRDGDTYFPEEVENNKKYLSNDWH